MASLKSYLSILSLNVNFLNAPIKCHRVADWIKRHDPSICCLQETHLGPKNTSGLKVKGWKTIFHGYGPQKKAGVAILIPDRFYFSKDFIYLAERQPAREGTQAGGMGEGEAGSQWRSLMQGLIP